MASEPRPNLLVSQQQWLAPDSQSEDENAPTCRYITQMSSFAYDAPAELFISKSRGANRRPMTYRRFATGAEAIRFVIEELPPVMLAGTILQVGEERYDCTQIRTLYESSDYPLQRSAS